MTTFRDHDMATYNGYTPRHAGTVCTEQADYIQDLVSALEDAQSWASDAESAAQNAHGAIESSLTESGLW